MSADYRISGNQNKKNYKGKNIYAGDCRKIRSHELFLQNEQMTGVEPARQPWEGRVLPLYYICSSNIIDKTLKNNILKKNLKKYGCT